MKGCLATYPPDPLPPPYYALFYTALFTGMRRSELLALRWQDMDLLLSQIYVSRSLHQLRDGSFVFRQPKTAKGRRTVALPPSAILVLNEHREKQELDRAMLGMPLTDDDLVFSALEGKPLCPNTITRAWPMLAARCGVKVIRDFTAQGIPTPRLCSNRVYTQRLSRRD